LPQAVNSAGEDDAKWRGWMRAAQAGDGDAYARLLREIAPVLRGRVRRDFSGHAAADVEDLVQDILLSLHWVRQTYDPERPFLPWALAIARHRVADALRRRYRAEAGEASAIADETFLQSAANRLSAESETAALRRAVAALPDSQRRAVELVKLRDMSRKEASAASGMSVAALKVATHRGIRTLRALLGAGNPGGKKGAGE
jgi:RNA polymerase sigma-70 factor (ECF subfamily)